MTSYGSPGKRTQDLLLWAPCWILLLVGSLGMRDTFYFGHWWNEGRMLAAAHGCPVLPHLQGRGSSASGRSQILRSSSRPSRYQSRAHGEAESLLYCSHPAGPLSNACVVYTSHWIHISVISLVKRDSPCGKKTPFEKLQNIIWMLVIRFYIYYHYYYIIVYKASLKHQTQSADGSPTLGKDLISRRYYCKVLPNMLLSSIHFSSVNILKPL